MKSTSIQETEKLQHVLEWLKSCPNAFEITSVQSGNISVKIKIDETINSPVDDIPLWTAE